MSRVTPTTSKRNSTTGNATNGITKPIAKIAKIVCDTGPIIGYARAGYLHLFPALFEEILIPQGVQEELLRGGDRPGAHEARGTAWLRITAAPANQTLATCLQSLGRGESEAIALAESLGLPLILEDGPARKIACKYVSDIVGSGTIIRSAVEKSLVTDGKAILLGLQAAGYRLSPQIIAKIVATL